MKAAAASKRSWPSSFRPERRGRAEEEANDNPVVVAEMTTPIESLTVSEAVMRLDLGGSSRVDVLKPRSWRP